MGSIGREIIQALAAGWKEAVAAAVRWSGLGWLLRWRWRRGATILVYHDPSAKVLDRHLRWLTRRYSIISLGKLVAAIRSGDAALLPPRSLVITLDDGRRGNADLVGVLTKHNVPATVYLCSQVVNSDRHFWFAGRDSGPLKNVPDSERIARLALAGFSPTQEFPGDRQSLRLDELRAMLPAFDFQSHGRFHSVLPCCDYKVAQSEVVESKIELEQLLGQPCEHFSYPNGDFGPREVELVRQAGYLSARTVKPGVNTLDTDPFRLPAVYVSDDASLNRLALQVTGIVPTIKRWFGRKRT